jgi:hypothetical protein
MNDYMTEMIEQFDLDLEKLSKGLIERLIEAQKQDLELQGVTVTPNATESNAKEYRKAREDADRAARRESYTKVLSYVNRLSAIAAGEMEQSEVGTTIECLPDDVTDGIRRLCAAKYRSGVDHGLADRLVEVACLIVDWANERDGRHEDVFSGPAPIHAAIRKCFDAGFFKGRELGIREGTVEALKLYRDRLLNSVETQTRGYTGSLLSTMIEELAKGGKP